MRVLLIQLPTSHLGAGERVYPLGLARLAGCVPNNIHVRGLDMNCYADPWPMLKTTLMAEQPHLVALSFRNIDPLARHHTSYLSSLKTAAHLVRLITPETTLLAGGPAFSLFARRLMMEIPELDAGVVGEGEAVFKAFFSEDLRLREVPGVIWRKGEALVQNPPGTPMTMKNLPALNTQLFAPEDYLQGNKYVAAVGIEGKRGCDLGCAYCVYPCLGGGEIRLRPPGQIVDEMEILHKRHGVSLFHFTDSVLNRPAAHFESLCRELVRRKLSVRWTGFFREDEFTHNLTQLALAAGLGAVYFSADALTEKGLALLNKRLTCSDLFRAARITADCNVLTMCHFLVNLPEEDTALAQEAINTLDQLLEIYEPAGNLGAVIFNTVRLYPGAPLTRRLIKSGALDPQVDLLYPVYHNPLQTAHRLYQLEARCHLSGVLSRLNIPFFHS